MVRNKELYAKYKSEKVLKILEEFESNLYSDQTIYFTFKMSTTIGQGKGLCN